MVTTLAILFILLLIGTIFYGFGIIMRRPPTEEELKTEKCSLCGQRFPKEELIERQVGDYRLLFFCAQCISSLHHELQEKDLPAGLDTKRLLSDIEGATN
jgi:hypothetical protein